MATSPACLASQQQAAEVASSISNFSSNCSSSSIGSVGSAANMTSSMETSGAALFVPETAAQCWQPDELQTQLPPVPPQQPQYFCSMPCEYAQYPQPQFPPQPAQQQLQQQEQQAARPQKPKRKRVASQAQRKAANVRERRRMFNLNEAFDTLRTKVPTFAFEKRLSRIETLRLAITYIRFMGQVINGVPPHQVRLRGAVCTPQPQPQPQPQHAIQFQASSQPTSLMLQQPQLQLQYPWDAAAPATSSTIWDPSKTN
ncbi:hypothetical protein BOX15_Mlig000937g1 [Macrostomum lignano]|uniref:BHLH domain-containing protein n=1 Tax=Macrostomum lignano TaxID=282301 RepID=A0A267EYW1_9PLAT|nr:hypothetical protein BOX15_Mlig000937g1 [Macrostomum lignano]